MASSTTPLDSDLPERFVSYIQRQTRWWVTEVQMGCAFSEEDQSQILHILSYALGTPALAQVGSSLTQAVAPLMEQAGLYDAWQPYLEAAITICGTNKNYYEEACLHYHLGILRQRTSQFKMAQDEFNLALAYFVQTNNLEWQVRLLNRLAYVARQARQLDKAQKWVGRAMELGVMNPEEQGYSCMVVGTLAYERHDWEQARLWLERSLSHWQETGQKRLVAWGFTNLGIPLWGLKQYEESIRCYTQGIDLFQSIPDPVHLATAEMNLGNVYLGLTKYDLALQYYYRAKQVFEKIRDILRLASLYNNMGMAHRYLTHWEDAERAYRLSVDYWYRLNNLRSLVNAMDGLGLTFLGQGDYRQAHQTFKTALSHLARIPEDPRYESLYQTIELHLFEAQSHLSGPS
jgi:tetratricopeptide (TPR) repeat protein